MPRRMPARPRVLLRVWRMMRLEYSRRRVVAEAVRAVGQKSM
jgi:hypothetical protein